MKNKIKRIISGLLIFCAVILPLGGIFTVNASAAQSVIDLSGTELNGATVLNDSNKYLITDSYIPSLDNGFNVADSTAGYALSKDGVGTPFASFYIDTLGEGGSVLKGASRYNGYDAYGFVAGSGEPIYRRNEETGEDVLVGYNSVAVKLKYNYSSNDNLTGTDGKSWSICDDSWKSTINGMAGVGVVGKGAVIVQKFVPTEEKQAPESQSDWKRLNEFSGEETDGLHTVNFFSEYNPATHQTPFVVYTPNGDDLQKGVYVKLTVAYELVHTETTGWWIFSSEEKTYKNVVEETVFYLCNTSAEVVFENLYYESGSAEESKTTENTTSSEQKGGAISNNQGAIDGFRVDMRGWNYDVTYHFNDSTNALPCTDGQVFLDVGKYDFVIRTKIGVVRTKTVYIHEKTNSKNIEVYFGDGLVSSDSIRIFAPSETYPVYVKDTVTLQTKDENLGLVKHAPLVGRVYLLNDDWNNVERDENGLPTSGLVAEKTADNHNWSFSDLKSGMYEAVFVNNEEYFDNTDTGDTYKFVWRFTIVEEGQAPVVNEELLYQQIGFSDYESKHYVVKLPTKGSGNVLVVFTDENTAYDFACKYLVSTVTVENSAYIFDGISYGSEEEMLTELRKKAHTMVEKRYYDAMDVNTYLTLKDSILTPVLSENPTEEEKAEYNAFVNILNREYDYDILVFLSEESREDAAIGEPFLNDRIYAYLDEDGEIKAKENPVYFISVSDYESSSVKLCLEGTDISYDLPYGVAVQAFLESKNAPTGRYKIVESNPSGTTEYYAIYIRSGDITTTVTFERVYNNNSITQTLGKINAGTRLRANNFKIVDIFNEFDPYGLIKIVKLGGETLVYQIDEYEDIPVIDEEGNYEIVLVDRLGNTVSFFVDIYTAKKVYTFTLTDGSDTLLSESAYGGKKFTLPTLTSQNEKLEFYGWKDEDGNVYTDTYTFNSPKNVNLTALWHYVSVNIDVYDGDKVESYKGKVGDLQMLPKLERDGYVLYGYRYVLEDGTVRFYRAQVSSIPNIESMRLDAVWKQQEDLTADIEVGSGNSVKVSLVDGGLHSTLTAQKGEILELPILEDKDGMTFLGWLYEYRLAGMIFTDKCNLSDIATIGMTDENSVKLVAVWLALPESEVSPLISGVGSISNGGGTASMVGGTTDAITKGITIGSIATLVVAMLALAIAFRSKLAGAFALILEKLKSRRRARIACGDELAINGIEHESANAYHARKRKPFNFGRLYKKVLVPCICMLLSFTMLYIASYQTIAYAVEDITNAVTEAKAEKALEEAIDEANELRTKQLASAMSSVQSSLGADDGSLTESEEFLYSNILVDLLSMGYQDVFTAYAVVGSNTPETDDDRIVDGIGYTAYVDAYEESGEYIFGAGFVSLASENSLTKEEVENGVIVQVSEEEADYYEYTEFRLTANQIWGPLHYVAYEKYVNYQVLDYVVQYTITDDDGTYNDALGDVYSYDIGEYCHYINYGEDFDFDAYGITSDMDYDEILQIFRESMETQMQNGIDITVEKADFISIQAINDYIAHNQDEAFLGVDAETLLYYEANITDTQYYVIYEDGTVGVLELPPDPPRQASIWERIAWAVGSIGVAIVGVVCCAIPGVGPILGGALISAALDVFMQTTVGGATAKDINWVSVGTSAVIGALTGGVGSGLSAAAANVTKGVVKQMLAKLGAEVVSGLFSGAATYLISAGVRGEELSFEECLKSMALGAVTGAVIFAGGQALSGIASKFGEKAFANYVKFAQNGGIILGGAAAGLVSYALACSITGQEFSVQDMLLSMAMGAATGALTFIGGKIVKTVQSAYEKRINKDDVARLKNRINKHLPSDKNKNWSYETIDANGNYIKSSKASLLENPNQKMYIVNQDGVRIEIIDGYPQFGNITSMKATIKDGIVLDRDANFEAFDSDLAKQWRKNPSEIPDDFNLYFSKKGIDVTELSAEDIEAARRGVKSGGLGYTWHECEDMHTGYLVKTSIHKSVSHNGGIEQLTYLYSTKNYEQLQKQKIYNVLKNLDIGES